MAMAAADVIGVSLFREMVGAGLIAGTTCGSGIILGPAGLALGGFLGSAVACITGVVELQTLLSTANPIISLALKVYNSIAGRAIFNALNFISLAKTVIEMIKRFLSNSNVNRQHYQ